MSAPKQIRRSDLPDTLCELMEGPVPPAEFVSNGATKAPDSIGPCDLRPAAHWHDYAYTIPGNRKSRFTHDQAFYRNLRKCDLPRRWAWYYYVGVRVFGVNYFRWFAHEKQPGLLERVGILFCAILKFAFLFGLLWPARTDADDNLGIRTRCEIVRWIDGDTVEVSLNYRARVRLLDCWAPETRGEGKQQGLAAKEYASKNWPAGTSAVLDVPTGDARAIGGVFSFGRVLGRLFVGGNDVGAAIVEAGHAKARRN